LESVISEQRKSIEESSRAHAEAVVEINRLEAEKVQLASELVAVSEKLKVELTTRDAMRTDDAQEEIDISSNALPVCHTEFSDR
jgi:hypothetical protein